MSVVHPSIPLGVRLHPFKIEHPAEYGISDPTTLDPDMQPFEYWEFYFDNGWSVCALDAHNEDSIYLPGEQWIFDFGAWETHPRTKQKVLHTGRHPQLQSIQIGFDLFTVDEMSQLLHRVCRFPDRTVAAKNISMCYTCQTRINRHQQISWDETIKPYHASCL
jgi:hypothetical protein